MKRSIVDGPHDCHLLKWNGTLLHLGMCVEMRFQSFKFRKKFLHKTTKNLCNFHFYPFEAFVLPARVDKVSLGRLNHLEGRDLSGNVGQLLKLKQMHFYDWPRARDQSRQFKVIILRTMFMVICGCVTRLLALQMKIIGGGTAAPSGLCVLHPLRVIDWFVSW